MDYASVLAVLNLTLLCLILLKHSLHVFNSCYCLIFLDALDMLKNWGRVAFKFVTEWGWILDGIISWWREEIFQDTFNIGVFKGAYLLWCLYSCTVCLFSTIYMPGNSPSSHDMLIKVSDSKCFMIFCNHCPRTDLLFVFLLHNA